MRKVWMGWAIVAMTIGTSGCHFWRHDRAPAPAVAEQVPTATPAAAESVADAGHEFPASYAGRVPCADCEGIDVRLNLFGDGVYFLREAYVGRADGEPAELDAGRWSRVGDPAVLQLHGGSGTPLQYAPQDDGSLAMLDAQGQPLAATIPARLTRDAEFRPLFPQLPMRGKLLVEGDRARFQDCLTGRDLEVTADEEAPALIAAYRAAGLPAGARVLATVQGQWQRRNGIDQLQVVRFRKLWPGVDCAPSYADAELEGSFWKLSWLDGASALADTTAQAASLTLDKDAQRASGSSGCNRYTMAYARDGETIRFSPGALTRMACPAAAMTQESAFMAMLGKVARGSVSGHELTLFDADGAALARFDALPFPEE